MTTINPDTNNIELGKEYKYRKLCNTLNIAFKEGTRSKESQLKELKCFLI